MTTAPQLADGARQPVVPATTAPAARHVPSAQLWRMAARDTLAVGSGTCAFGLVLGITVDALGRSAWATMLGTATVYGGSAQLATATLLANGATLALAVLSGCFVQLRLLLYSAAMGERFAGQGRLFQWLAPHMIIDQTYIAAQGRPELVGPDFKAYWLRLGGLVLAAWSCSVAAGLLLAPHVPPLPHLTLVCAAMFLGLLAPRLVTRPAVAAAAAGAATTFAVGTLVPSLGIISGVLVGMAAGLLSGRDQEGERS